MCIRDRYDKHVNLANDMNAYFGGFAGYKNLLFSENMTTGATAKDAMESWKKDVYKRQM